MHCIYTRTVQYILVHTYSVLKIHTYDKVTIQYYVQYMHTVRRILGCSTAVPFHALHSAHVESM